ncbi:MAG: type I DNA topoisomerase [Candidatus Omnitrophica bacterium]|nr:type I DNA topoisomerase [Candidatus Omnitrophota bacterium]
MAKGLVIVESPAKAKTLNKILGDGYTVESSMGHVMDLRGSSMSVEIENNFKPHYSILPGRKKVINKLKKTVKDEPCLYLATDPDREGEAISWHLSNLLGKNKTMHRVVFHEITPEAVREAFKHPTTINMNLVNAQQARRILDRIVGYSLSPLLWKKVGRGLSAGRVQSVAVKLIVEREKEIKNFIPQEYWEIEAELKKRKIEHLTPLVEGKSTPPPEESFKAKLEKIGENKAEIKNRETAEDLVEKIKREKFLVKNIELKQKRKNPQPPFTTSKLQQEAFNKLHFSAEKTMRIAQQLYEGIDLGKEETVGLITYMRTDSVRVADSALEELRRFIQERFGKDYLPDVSYQYRSKKSAQEAHEAIRPTSVLREPDKIKGYLTSEQFKLYELIWRKFVASQMNPAVFEVMSVDIQAGEYLFSASGSKLLFPGYLIIYKEDNNNENILPILEEGEELLLMNLLPSQHFTKPPPRYSDATLVKALEEEGIGRPSTYAPIIQTIIARDYVRRDKGYFFPTEMGMIVTELLEESFPDILNLRFTAEMEEKLDEVEEGSVDWVKLLHEFYEPFKRKLNIAQVSMRNVRKETIATDQVCAECGRPMVIKWGRKGKFLSCSGYPECKNAKTITTGVKCPQEGCNGELVERKSRKGFFYGCSNYPNCKFTARKLPVVQNTNS